MPILLLASIRMSSKNRWLPHSDERLSESWALPVIFGCGFDWRCQIAAGRIIIRTGVAAAEAEAFLK